jgi:hypothetical protein
LAQYYPASRASAVRGAEAGAPAVPLADACTCGPCVCRGGCAWLGARCQYAAAPTGWCAGVFVLMWLCVHVCEYVCPGAGSATATHVPVWACTCCTRLAVCRGSGDGRHSIPVCPCVWVCVGVCLCGCVCACVCVCPTACSATATHVSVWACTCCTRRAVCRCCVLLCACQTQRKLAPPTKHDPSPHPLAPEGWFSTAAASVRLELGASTVTIFGIVLRARVVLPRLWGLRTAV